MKCLAWLCFISGLTIPPLALAATTPIEASMVITGTITVNPDGSVKTYTLHEQDKVPSGVVNLVKQTIQGWQFEPVMEDGKAVTAKAGMAVRVVANLTGADAQYATIQVTGAQFGCNAYQAKTLLPNACQPGTTVEPEQREPPLYPLDALRAGAEGVVYLMVEVGRDGRVIRTAASQVNLYHRTRRDPKVMREALSKAAEAAAMHWKFKAPTVGPEAAKGHWVVRVPVSYKIRLPSTGTLLRNTSSQWTAYIPGPVQDVPWADEPPSGGTADASTGGAPFVKDTRFVLLTPIGSGEKPQTGAAPGQG